MMGIDSVAQAEVLSALPPRLRKRLDAVLERVAQWRREAGASGDSELIHFDDQTTVSLRLTGGVVCAADDVVCNCLLAPACLHRAAVAASLQVYEPDSATEPVGAAKTEAAELPVNSPVGDIPEVRLSAREHAAASALWDAASAILIAGLVGGNLFLEAELSRATHQARALNLHRAAATGMRLAAALRAAREDRPGHRVALLTADLRELLLISYQLLHPSGSAGVDELRGISRRSYDDHGSMRLHGPFTEPVVSATGHAGVVGYAVDDSGVIWSSANIGPGGGERVRPSYDAPLKLGNTTLPFRELGRSSLLVSGASGSPDGRLSGGGGTRAVRADGVPWTEDPIAGLFSRPLGIQFGRALRAEREDETFRAGDDLVFLRGQVRGIDQGALILELEDPENPASEGASSEAIGFVRCVPASRSDAYSTNLARLAGTCPRVHLIGRPVKTSPGTVLALAAAWPDSVNLGLDTIPAPEASESEPADEPPVLEPAAQPLFDADPTALHLVQHHVEQAVAGGRAMLRTALLERDCARLDRDALHTAASLLREMQVRSKTVRDEFYRTIETVEISKDAYPHAWLTAAVYAKAANEEFTVNRWLRALT